MLSSCIGKNRCIVMCNFVIYAILLYYTCILDITMTVGIFRIPYTCHEI